MIKKLEERLETFKLYRGFKIFIQVLCGIFFLLVIVGSVHENWTTRKFPISELVGLGLGIILGALLLIFLIRAALLFVMRVAHERPENMVWRFTRDLAEFLNDILTLVWSVVLFFAVPLACFALLGSLLFEACK